MTSVTEVQSASTRLFAVRGAPWWVLLQVTTLLCCKYFSSSSVVSHAFSALCVYSTFGHHPHPLGYLCAKFRFFRSLHCWASHGEKSHTQSLTHSPSLFDTLGTEALELQNSIKVTYEKMYHSHSLVMTILCIILCLSVIFDSINKFLSSWFNLHIWINFLIHFNSIKYRVPCVEMTVSNA